MYGDKYTDAFLSPINGPVGEGVYVHLSVISKYEYFSVALSSSVGEPVHIKTESNFGTSSHRLIKVDCSLRVINVVAKWMYFIADWTEIKAEDIYGICMAAKCFLLDQLRKDLLEGLRSVMNNEGVFINLYKSISGMPLTPFEEDFKQRLIRSLNSQHWKKPIFKSESFRQFCDTQSSEEIQDLVVNLL